MMSVTEVTFSLTFCGWPCTLVAWRTVKPASGCSGYQKNWHVVLCLLLASRFEKLSNVLCGSHRLTRSDRSRNYSARVSASYPCWLEKVGLSPGHHRQVLRRFVIVYGLGFYLDIGKFLEILMNSSRCKNRRRSLFTADQAGQSAVGLGTEPRLGLLTRCLLTLLRCEVCWASSLPGRRVCILPFFFSRSPTFLYLVIRTSLKTSAENKPSFSSSIIIWIQAVSS
jgi:hypothetical protein